jgi:hypothetical protein
VSCTANEFVECREDKALTCNATGDNYDLLSCAYGCGENGCKPAPPCETLECQKHIIPKYLPSECDTLATTDLTISANTPLNTSDMTKCTSVITQPGAPDLCVLHYATITIERNQTLTVTGTRALALVADRTLLVDGTIDASASRGKDGPGGGGAHVSGTTSNNTKSGGGAGYRTAGGNGASSTADGGAMNGGAAEQNPLQLAVLAGGARSNADSVGGGGGGAVTLVSCRGELSIPGLVDVGGGGGLGEYNVSNTHTYAGGGGAGGTIVLQGFMVKLTGQLFSNGGAGGGGGVIASAGEDATRSSTAALGGTDNDVTNPTRTGGAGGTNLSPGPGKLSGGGGGGASGFMLVYVPTGTAPILTPEAVSPQIEPAAFVATN